VGFEILGLVLKVLVSCLLMHVSSWTIWILKMEAASSCQNGDYLAVNRASYTRRLEVQPGKNLQNLPKEMQYKDGFIFKHQIKLLAYIFSVMFFIMSASILHFEFMLCSC
jgi:hypothetical protein